MSFFIFIFLSLSKHIHKRIFISIFVLSIFTINLYSQLPKAGFINITSNTLNDGELGSVNSKLYDEIYKSGYFDLVDRANLEMYLKNG